MRPQLPGARRDNGSGAQSDMKHAPLEKRRKVRDRKWNEMRRNVVDSSWNFVAMEQRENAEARS